MRYILILLIISVQVSIISSATFCFPTCSGCNGVNYNSCSGTGCRSGSGFSKPGSAGSTYTCTRSWYTYYSTGAKWEPCAQSPDIPGTFTMGTSVNITIQPLTMSVTTQQTCSDGGWEIYIYFGDLRGGDTMLVTHPGVIDNNVYYYQVRIIYGVITFDEWDQNTIITTTFTTDPTSTPYTNTLGTTTQSKVCKDNNKF